MGSLVADLLTIQQGACIVRAQVQVGALTLATGMAMDSNLEQAEDRAKIRALETLRLPAVPSPLNWPLPSPPVPPPANGEPVNPSFDQPLPSPEPIAPSIVNAPSMVNHPLAAPPEPPSVIADWYSHITLNPEEEAQVGGLPALEESRPGKGDRSDALNPAPPALEELAPLPAVVDLSDVISQIDVEMRRLNWTRKRGSEHLKQTYGRTTRGELSESELYDFLTYLQAQPSPGGEK